MELGSLPAVNLVQLVVIMKWHIYILLRAFGTTQILLTTWLDPVPPGINMMKDFVDVAISISLWASTQSLGRLNNLERAIVLTHLNGTVCLEYFIFNIVLKSN